MFVCWIVVLDLSCILIAICKLNFIKWKVLYIISVKFFLTHEWNSEIWIMNYNVIKRKYSVEMWFEKSHWKIIESTFYSSNLRAEGKIKSESSSMNFVNRIWVKILILPMMDCNCGMKKCSENCKQANMKK